MPLGQTNRVLLLKNNQKHRLIINCFFKIDHFLVFGTMVLENKYCIENQFSTVVDYIVWKLAFLLAFENLTLKVLSLGASEKDRKCKRSENNCCKGLACWLSVEMLHTN